MLPDLFRFSSAPMTRARLKWLATSLVGSRQRQVSTRAPRLGDPARAAAHTRGGRAFRGAMRLLLAGERRPLRSRLLVRPTSSCGAPASLERRPAPRKLEADRSEKRRVGKGGVRTSRSEWE